MNCGASLSEYFRTFALSSFLFLLLSVFLRQTTCDEVYAAGPRNVTLFQTLDASFILLWLNWWVVALEFGAIPRTWNIYIACFGEETAELVKLFHAPGCSREYNVEDVNYKDQIYFAKWLAITDAYK